MAALGPWEGAGAGVGCEARTAGHSPEAPVLLVSDLPGQQDAQRPGPVPCVGAGLQRPQARELRASASEDLGDLLVRL